MGGGPGRSELKTPLAKNCGYVTLASQHVILRPLVAPAGRISLALSVQVGSSPALGSRRKNTGVNESKFTLSEVPAPGRACDRFEAQTRTDHNDPPLTILATFTVPAPISVAVRLRRVWYRSAAPIVASNGLHLSSVPKVVDLFMSPRTPRTSNWSLATLRRPVRYAKMTVASPGRTRISAARRAASAHARREFVRTKVGIRL